MHAANQPNDAVAVLELCPKGRPMANQALFEGLIYDEYDQPVRVSHVGEEAYYVVDDEGFPVETDVGIT